MATPSLCLVQLRDGDELATLAREWKLPGSVTDGARQIAAWNNVAFNSRAIDAWVMSSGGRRLPFVAADPFDAANRLGWGVFTAASRILMPPGPRPCVDVITIDDPLLIVADAARSSTAKWVVGGLFLGGLLWAFSAPPAKKKKDAA